jgi:hypothetical protein
MKRAKEFFNWLFSWSIISSALLGGSIGLHIKQYRTNDLQMEVNRRFHNESKTIVEIFDAKYSLDSIQSVRILELWGKVDIVNDTLK